MQPVNTHCTDLFYFLFFRATPVAHGNSQAGCRIGAAAVGLHISHGNLRSRRSEPSLRPIPQLRATGSFTHWVGPRMESASSWILVGFVTAKPQRELLHWPFLKSEKYIYTHTAFKIQQIQNRARYFYPQIYFSSISWLNRHHSPLGCLRQTPQFRYYPNFHLNQSQLVDCRNQYRPFQFSHFCLFIIYHNIPWGRIVSILKRKKRVSLSQWFQPESQDQQHQHPWVLGRNANS